MSTDTNQPQKKVINAQTGGQTPNQNPPSGNQQPPKQSGGGPEGVAKQNTAALNNAVTPPSSVGVSPQGNAQTAPNVNDVDIEKMISTSEGEIKTLDEETQRRKDVTELLQTALAARARFRKVPYNNTETGEVLGSRIKYEPDNDGKTIYDYMNDEVVSQYIQFVAAEGDPMDGSPVDRQITFYWKKPTL